MFKDSFEELFNILKGFGKALLNCGIVLIKTIIFWGMVFLPLILGIGIGVIKTNLIIILIGFIIEVIWACIFICSDSHR